MDWAPIILFSLLNSVIIYEIPANWLTALQQELTRNCLMSHEYPNEIVRGALYLRLFYLTWITSTITNERIVKKPSHFFKGFFSFSRALTKLMKEIASLTRFFCPRRKVSLSSIRCLFNEMPCTEWPIGKRAYFCWYYPFNPYPNGDIKIWKKLKTMKFSFPSNWKSGSTATFTALATSQNG